jgi:hypothetical protein
LGRGETLEGQILLPGEIITNKKVKLKVGPERNYNIRRKYPPEESDDGDSFELIGIELGPRTYSEFDRGSEFVRGVVQIIQ